MVLRTFVDTPKDQEYTTKLELGRPMESLFLACFAFGTLFTLISVVLGMAGDGLGHVHHGGHVGHGTHHTMSLPLLNASSVVGALTWFGAAGYLLLRLGDWALPVAILGALLAGAAGWYLVARFLKLVLSGERVMDPDDYRLEGTIGQITVGSPAGGTGEVVFSKAGGRRSEAARSTSGAAIPRGSEVVITTYADGFATVQPWAEFLATRDTFTVTEKREA